MVPKVRFELTRPYGHYALNVARLPVPPLRRIRLNRRIVAWDRRGSKDTAKLQVGLCADAGVQLNCSDARRPRRRPAAKTTPVRCEEFVAKRSGTSRGFTVFAIVMALFLVLGTLVVFGGTIFDPSSDDSQDPIDDASRQRSELMTQVAEDPDDADSAAVLANIYANEGNITEAVPLYEKATIGRPDDGNLRLAFGIALLRGGSFLDARVQFERALDLMPGSSGPAYYLGQLEERRPEPDLDAARAWYEQAVETDPESVMASQAQERLAALDAAQPTATP